MALVELRRFSTEVEAELARLRLEAAGIGSVIFNGSAGYVSLRDSVRLMVIDEDRDEASAILDEPGEEQPC